MKFFAHVAVIFLWSALLGNCFRALRQGSKDDSLFTEWVYEYPSTCPEGDRTGLFATNATEVRSSVELTTTDALFTRLAESPESKAFSPVVRSRSPWILQLDSFLSPQECEQIIQECTEFKADVVVDAAHPGAASLQQLQRNSSSFHCNGGEACNDRPGIALFRKRFASLLGINYSHTEGFHVLKYEEGGFYKQHHDFIPRDKNPGCFDAWGPRVLTFFAYLSDVEGGGDTRFPELNIDIKPKAGRAVVFADTVSGSPFQEDQRALHEAVLVTKGVKLTATTWVHEYDFAANFGKCCQ